MWLGSQTKRSRTPGAVSPWDGAALGWPWRSDSCTPRLWGLRDVLAARVLASSSGAAAPACQGGQDAAAGHARGPRGPREPVAHGGSRSRVSCLWAGTRSVAGCFAGENSVPLGRSSPGVFWCNIKIFCSLLRLLVLAKTKATSSCALVCAQHPKYRDPALSACLTLRIFSSCLLCTLPEARTGRPPSPTAMRVSGGDRQRPPSTHFGCWAQQLPFP